MINAIQLVIVTQSGLILILALSLIISVLKIKFYESKVSVLEVSKVKGISLIGVIQLLLKK